ncbi:MAG: biotin--[acetyl-CoA-carboxylase] ligase [Tannerellaceae bacterium]|nr:biotin--[acetyl-CoA-carboxylase] ligase [Tannerellaceae bacterium]MCD8263764.1 biotin--[acetyl-CoA-carboxylase] ligase [Tannerellaceae bacterium]
MSEQPEKPLVIYVPETASTNAYIRRLHQHTPLEEGSVVVAGFQTAGKGQVGNSWESEAGKNLTFSILIFPRMIRANQQFLLSQITSLSVKKTLEQYTGDITVKWPNDIYWHNRKICGILIENELAGQYIDNSVIGIGINLNQQAFKGNAPNPVSLVNIIGKEVQPPVVLDLFLATFYAWYAQLWEGNFELIRREYMASLYRRQGYHRYKDRRGEFEAMIYAIEPDGHLLLQLRDQTIRRYAFKEVTWI